MVRRSTFFSAQLFSTRIPKVLGVMVKPYASSATPTNSPNCPLLGAILIIRNDDSPRTKSARPLSPALSFFLHFSMSKNLHISKIFCTFASIFKNPLSISAGLYPALNRPTPPHHRGTMRQCRTNHASYCTLYIRSIYPVILKKHHTQ